LPGQDPQHRRLAGAVRPEEAEEFPALDRELNAFQRVDRAIPFRESGRLDRRPGRADARDVI